MMEDGEERRTQSIEHLHRAIAHHDNEEITRLLQIPELGIDQQVDKITALGLAIEKENSYAVKALLQAGADINSETYCLAYCTYERPIVTAARVANKEIFHLLLDSGCPLDLSCDGHKDALQWTATHGDMNMLQDLLRLPGANVNWINTHGDTCLHYATMGGYEDIVQLLLEKGAEISENNEWRSPVHIASLHGYVGILKQLLDKRPRASNKDMYNNTPLSIAAWRNRKEAMEILVPYLSKELQEEEMQRTLDHALGSAVRGRGLAACEFLLRHSASPNFMDSSGIFSLNETFRMPVNTIGMSLFTKLMAAGARLDIVDHSGLIPFYRLLIGNGDYVQPFLFGLIYHGADCCSQDLTLYLKKRGLCLLNPKPLILPASVVKRTGSRVHDEAFLTLTKFIKGSTELGRIQFGGNIMESEYYIPCQTIEATIASIPKLVCLARSCIRQKALAKSGRASVVPYIDAIPNIPSVIRQYLKLMDILENYGFQEEGGFITPAIAL